jgi:hypothetical protein
MTTLGSVRIRGTVLRGGKPLEGAYLTLNDGDDLIAERRTGPDGVYEFHISPGDWKVICRAAGSEPVTLTVDSEGGDVALDFDL